MANPAALEFDKMLDFVNKDYMANMRSGSMYGAGTSTNLSIMGGMHSHNQ